MNNSDGPRLVDGRYRLLRKLGHGAMGDVYEAIHLKTEGRRAVKFLRPEVAADAGIAARFHREAKILDGLHHPNIVRVTDFGEEPDGTLYLVQDFLDGEDFGNYLAAHGPLKPGEARRLLAPVMSAVAAANDRGVLHRDLKPGNIFLARDASGAITPMVIDFGIAKRMHGDGSSDRTDTGLAPGTLVYMSPEQLQARRDLDGRSDVWAMGVIWYRVLSGKRPFAADSDYELAARILSQEPTPIASEVPDLPPALAQAIMRALEKRREDRFASMHEFLDAVLLDGQDPVPEHDPQPPHAGPPPPPLPDPVTPAQPLSARSTLVLKDTSAPAPTGEPGTLSRSAAQLIPVPPRPKPRFRWIAAAFSAAFIVLAAAGATRRWRTPAAPVASPGMAALIADMEADDLPDLARDPDPPPLRVVPVLVKVTPAAELFIGEVHIGRSPQTVEVTDGQPVKVRATLPGYESAVIPVDGSSDSVNTSLKKLRVKPPPRRKGIWREEQK